MFADLDSCDLEVVAFDRRDSRLPVDALAAFYSARNYKERGGGTRTQWTCRIWSYVDSVDPINGSSFCPLILAGGLCSRLKVGSAKCAVCRMSKGL